MATDVQELAEQEKRTIFLRVKALMLDGRWRSGPEIARIVGCSDSCATARVRDLRKEKYGSYEVKREVFPDKVHRYQLVVPEAEAAA
jgi:hypothetical protein